jgi:hypothetical protein
MGDGPGGDGTTGAGTTGAAGALGCCALTPVVAMAAATNTAAALIRILPMVHSPFIAILTCVGLPEQACALPPLSAQRAAVR